MTDEETYDPRSRDLGFKLYPERLRSPEVNRFVEITRRLCLVYENAESVPLIDLLRDLDRLLPELYAAASYLPEREWFPDEEDPDDFQLPPSPKSPLANKLGRLEEWHYRMNAVLGWHRIMHIVFDPADGNDPKSIPADLGHLLGDIYVHLTEWLALYDLGGDVEMEEAIWHWRFDWEHEWGSLLVHAMCAIQSLVHFHYDEDDEGFTKWLA